MIISLNWLKKHVDIDMPVDELVELIGNRLVEVEGVTNLGDKYKDVLVVKAVEVDKIAGSDHLSLVKIDDGGITGEIERDENNLIQVVCGATNIKSGLLAAWLPPKSIVPSTYSDLEQFTLDTRKIRGVMSNGMIASAQELDISDDSEGILEINDNIQPGTLFSVAYELDDYLLDIENKSLTNRPDCFGIIGFAREVSAILGKEFKSPEWFLDTEIRSNLDDSEELISVKIDDSKLAARYLAVVMDALSLSKKSKMIVQTYLSRMGVRPISAVVDVTNYLMLLSGQPLHAFDYDKVLALCDASADIHVRTGKKGEKLELLDNRVIELSVDDIVISAGSTAIALAGAMGGLNTAIDDGTRRIVLESASFDLYRLRATQMRHGIYSEAITRFTKGQPAELTAPVLSRAIDMISGLTGARCLGSVVEDYPVKQDSVSIELPIEKINSVLGSDFSKDKICIVLASTGFIIEKKNEDLMLVDAPFWRSDIHIAEDIIEEVGRIIGFDNIKPTLPSRETKAVMPAGYDLFRTKLRDTLAGAGANEVLSYSFVHGDTITKVGQNVDNSYRLVNSISPNLQYYRQTLIPSLFRFVFSNTKQGFSDFALFELNKAHKKEDGLNDEGVPVESESIAFIVSSKKPQSGAAYYRAKKFFDYLCSNIGVTVGYEKIEGDKSTNSSVFDLGRSAQIFESKTGAKIGYIGEFKSAIVKSFKIPKYSAGFEVDTALLFEFAKTITNEYVPLSKYPGTERDICFSVDDVVSCAQVISAAEDVVSKTKFDIVFSLVDIYKADDSETKNITIHVKITPLENTLTGDEVTDIINEICISVTKATGAAVV